MNLNPKFKLHLPGIHSPSNQNKNIIGVSIHEYNTTVGYYSTQDDSIHLVNASDYPTKEYSSLFEILDNFIANHNIQDVNRIGIAVPGPVINGISTPERLGWTINVEEYRTKYNVEKAFLLNDVEASAYGMAFLTDEDITTIYTSENRTRGNMAILAPGNGLGEAAYFFDGECLRPFATEGGHSEFSPRTTVEVEFYQFLNNIYGIVSWESVLSKNGLFNIYRFLRDVKRHPEPEWLAERFAQGDFTQELYRAATEDDVLICKIALNTYIEFLAREANNLTLKLKAIGGLLITGEIPNLLKDYIDKNKFYEKYKISDKMEFIFKNIPIYMVDNKNSELNGAAAYAAFIEK